MPPRKKIKKLARKINALTSQQAFFEIIRKLFKIMRSFNFNPKSILRGSHTQ